MSLTTPSKINMPFAQNGNRNAINDALQTGDASNKATYQYGFPQITMTPKASGGLPPFGRDMNGILFSITAMLQYTQAGGTYTYDEAFANAIGGYGKGALVQQSDLSGFWVSTADENTSNPETDSTDWMPLDSGSYTFSVSTANVTLTNAQAAHPVLIINGTLTGSRIIYVPTFRQIWTIVNNVTRGTYTLTIKTANGTGVTIKRSVEQVVCDGTNILRVSADDTAQVPVGAKVDWFGSTIPAGYLVANGQAVSRILYPELFAVYGTFYGAGDGSTTFNVPNLMNRFVRCGTLEQRGVTAEDSIRSHTHGVTQESHYHNVNDSGHTHSTTVGSAGTHSHTGSTGAAGAHTHSRGTMNIVGEFSTSRADDHYSGAFSRKASGKYSNRQDASDGHWVAFDASKGWSGNTSSAANHTHTISSDGNHTHTVTANENKTGITLGGAVANITINNFGGTETAPMHMYGVPIIRAI